MPKFLSSFLLPFSFLDFFWSFLSQFRITRSLSLFQSPPRTTKYEYTPLDANTTDIRLVELLPGVQDDPIRISIVTKPLVIPAAKEAPPNRLKKIQDALIASEIRYLAFENLEGRIGFWNPQEETTSWRHPDPHYSNARHELDEPAPIVAQPSFEALSYTWGSNEDHADIEVVHVAQSLSLDSTMTVQQNLLDALIHLRSPTSTRTLWIDAICLNQEDLVERSQQVKRMGDIYRCAWRVVVWLGLPAFNSSRALQLLGRVGDMVEISRRRQILPAPGCKLETFPIVEASSIDGDEETWIAVDKLLSRPWFKRVWIIQEIKLANPTALIQCGADTIPWRLLRRGIIACTGMTFPSPAYETFRQLLGDRYSLAFTARFPDPLMQLLHVVATRLCSDPRDKVFGLLGLFPPELSRLIHPRYTDSPRDVFRNAAIAFIECTGSLDILTLSGPSWIPDWSESRSAAGRDNDRCSGTSSAHVSFDGNVLTASGVKFDRVATTAYPVPTPDSAEKDKAIIAYSWLAWLSCFSANDTYPTGESLAAACAWTINTGVLSDRWGKQLNGAPTLAAASLIFEQIQANFASNVNGKLPTAKLRKNHVAGSMFRTAKGYFGICFNKVEPDDQVVVLLGCRFAVILRPLPDTTYLFVGCAYVHGIMDAEVLLGPMPEGWEVLIRGDENGDQQQRFRGPDGGEGDEDPRLGEMGGEWERVWVRDGMWPEKQVKAWRDRKGRVMRSDPRMISKALRERGVVFEEFRML